VNLGIFLYVNLIRNLAPHVLLSVSAFFLSIGTSYSLNTWQKLTELGYYDYPLLVKQKYTFHVFLLHRPGFLPPCKTGEAFFFE